MKHKPSDKTAALHAPCVYRCRKTGKDRWGQVQALGRKGATVLDLESGRTVKVDHGFWRAEGAQDERLGKARKVSVKAHPRITASGKVVQVKQHQAARRRAQVEQPSPAATPKVYPAGDAVAFADASWGWTFWRGAPDQDLQPEQYFTDDPDTALHYARRLQGYEHNRLLVGMEIKGEILDATDDPIGTLAEMSGLTPPPDVDAGDAAWMWFENDPRLLPALQKRGFVAVKFLESYPIDGSVSYKYLGGAEITHEPVAKVIDKKDYAVFVPQLAADLWGDANAVPHNEQGWRAVSAAFADRSLDPKYLDPPEDYLDADKPVPWDAYQIEAEVSQQQESTLEKARRGPSRAELEAAGQVSMFGQPAAPAPAPAPVGPTRQVTVKHHARRLPSGRLVMVQQHQALRTAAQVEPESVEEDLTEAELYEREHGTGQRTEVVDHGEVVPDARKMQADLRGARLADIEALGEREAVKQITKAKLWPKDEVSLEALRDGRTPGAVHFIQKLYAQIAAKPDDGRSTDHRTARADYYHAIGRLQAAVETVVDAQSAEHMYIEWEAFGRGCSVEWTTPAELVERFPDQTWVGVAPPPGQTFTTVGYIDGEIVRMAPSAVPGSQIERTYDNQRTAILHQDPATAKMWKGLRTLGKRMRQGLRMESRRSARTIHALRQSLYDARKYDANPDEGWAALGAKGPAKRTGQQGNRWERAIGAQRRVGGPPVPDDVSPAEIAEAFGFRAVQFGRYVDDDLARGHVAKAYAAFVDLADVLGLDPRQVSNAGQLALAFGARGRGGRAAAHYEPDQRVINLTAIRGGGTLAHEWGHFMDHMLSGDTADVTVTGGRARARFGSFGEGATPEIRQAFEELHAAIMTGPSLEPEAAAVRAREVKREIEKINQQIKYLRMRHGGAARLRQSDEGVARYNELVNQHNELAKEHTAVRLAAVGKPPPSKFASDAADLGKYWARPQELFARAFESWVEDRLTSQGRANTYLVEGTQVQYGMERRGLSGLEPYPVGEDRARINAAMDRLFDRLRTSGWLRKAWRRLVVTAESLLKARRPSQADLEAAGQVGLFGGPPATPSTPARRTVQVRPHARRVGNRAVIVRQHLAQRVQAEPEPELDEEVAEAQVEALPDVGPYEAWVKPRQLPFLRAAIARLWRRAEKLGVPKPEINIGEEIVRSYPDVSGQPYEVKLVRVTVDPGQTVKLAGFTLVGVVDHEQADGGGWANVVNMVPAYADRDQAAYRTGAPRCDHCRKIRHRKQTFLVEGKRGKVDQIGRTCVRDFLEGHRPEDLLALHGYLHDLGAVADRFGAGSDDDDGLGARGGTDGIVSFDRALVAAIAHVREHGFVSRAQAEHDNALSTGQQLREALFVDHYKPDPDTLEELLDEAAAVREWARSIDPEEKGYLGNLRSVFMRPGVTRDSIGLVASAVVAKQRAELRAAQKQSEPIGKVGQRIGGKKKGSPPAIDAVVERVHVSDTGGYDGQGWVLLVFRSEAGDLLKWFTNATYNLQVGDKVEVTGTIKGHDEYRGDVTTEIKRGVVRFILPDGRRLTNLEAIEARQAETRARVASEHARWDADSARIAEGLGVTRRGEGGQARFADDPDTVRTIAQRFGVDQALAALTTATHGEPTPPERVFQHRDEARRAIDRLQGGRMDRGQDPATHPLYPLAALEHAWGRLVSSYGPTHEWQAKLRAFAQHLGVLPMQKAVVSITALHKAKATVRSHTRVTASGKVSTVKQHQAERREATLDDVAELDQRIDDARGQARARNNRDPGFTIPPMPPGGFKVPDLEEQRTVRPASGERVKVDEAFDAVVEAAVKAGGKVEHRSISGSVYLTRADGARLRIADHRVPESALRSYGPSWARPETMGEQILVRGRRADAEDLARGAVERLVAQAVAWVKGEV